MNQKIIVIDGSGIAQEYIRASLMDAGFGEVSGFTDPLAALDAFGAGDAEADLILLDILMPDMDGFELCRRIREMDRDVPIVMLTSRRDRETLSQARRAGADDFVAKPFDRIELRRRMLRCLRQERVAAAVTIPPPSGATDALHR